MNVFSLLHGSKVSFKCVFLCTQRKTRAIPVLLTPIQSPAEQTWQPVSQGSFLCSVRAHLGILGTWGLPTYSSIWTPKEDPEAHGDCKDSGSSNTQMWVISSLSILGMLSEMMKSVAKADVFLQTEVPEGRLLAFRLASGPQQVKVSWR